MTQIPVTHTKSYNERNGNVLKEKKYTYISFIDKQLKNWKKLIENELCITSCLCLKYNLDMPEWEY